MKKFFLWGVLGLLAALLLPGLSLHAGDWNSEGFGGFSLGVVWPDISDLNDVLQANGYAGFDKADLTLGIEGFRVFDDRFLVGTEFHYASQKTSTSTIDQQLNIFLSYVDFGYMVISNQDAGLNLYPMVGLGASWMNLRLTERGGVDFSDIMADPGREAYLDKWDFIVQAAVGADYRVTTGRSLRSGKTAAYLGVRAGYQLSVTSSDWNLAKIDVPGGPDTGVSGFFLRFAVGGAR
jgi:hypothetical protein